MGGRANSVRPRRCRAERRGGNCPASGHSWTGAECRKGLGWMEAEWPVFSVRSGQPEKYFRRQGQATKGRRGERATPGVRTAANDVFWIARYVVQSGPHTRAAGIPCQSAAAIRPQGYCIRSSPTFYVISLAFLRKDASQSSGAILYDPDSADDIDDDDPDEDLDI
jgi:hypothetical protein